MTQTTEKLPKKAVMTIIGMIILMCAHNVRTSMASTLLFNANATLGGANTFAICISLSTMIECALVPFVAKFNSIYKTRRATVSIGIIIYVIEYIIMFAIPSMNVVQWTFCFTGVAGSLIAGTGYTIISETAGPQQAGKWMGVYGTCNSVAKVVPVVMGVAIDLYTYRAALAILLVAAACGGALLIFNMVKPTEEQAKQNVKIDIPAALSFSLALASLLSIFSFANSYFPWGSTGNLVLIGIAIVTVILTVVFERKRGVDAVIPTPVFKNRNMVLLLIITIAYTGIVMCASVFLPIYMQSVMQTSAFQATLPTILYAPAGILLAVPISTAIGKKRNGKPWLLGFALIAVIYAAAMMFILKPTANLIVIYIICVIYGILPAGAASVVPTSLTRMVPQELAVYSGPIMVIGTGFGASLGSALYLGYYTKMGAEVGMKYGYITLIGFAVVVAVLSLFLKKPE